MTMTHLNLSVWILSFTLQTVLLAVLLARGIARRLPTLAVLIGFYLLRSVALYAASGHHRTPAYTLVFSSLALIDVLLQVGLAWELFSAAMEQPLPALLSRPSASAATHRVPSSTPILTRLAIFALLLIGAAAAAFCSPPISRLPLVYRSTAASSSLERFSVWWPSSPSVPQLPR